MAMGTDNGINEPINDNQPTVYQIRIAGRLSQRWQARFDEMVISRGGNGDTLLTGPVVDQAALHGLLRAVRDLGLSLISVNEIDRQQWETPEPTWIQDCQDGTEDDA
jgi:hypothetical protein